VSDWEGDGLEELARLSYIRRYINLVTESVKGLGMLRYPMDLCPCVSEALRLVTGCLFYYESRNRELKTRLIYMRIGAMKDSKTIAEFILWVGILL
jgi:hypothetical protein